MSTCPLWRFSATLNFLICSFLALHHNSFTSPSLAAAQALQLATGWSFSTDLSFPSNSSELNSNSDIAAQFSLFVPVLSSSAFDSGSKGFSLGFLSLFDSPSSAPSRILLSVCLGFRENGLGRKPFLVPVWILNTTSPLKQQGQEGLVKLQVGGNRSFSLIDGDGKEVWSVEQVHSMEMQSDGNLVFRDGLNRSVWESFDTPTDSLVPGQKLRLGMELTSRNSMYKAVMEAGGALSYQVTDYEWPLIYAILPANATLVDYFTNTATAFLLERNAPINLTASLAHPNCTRTDGDGSASPPTYNALLAYVVFERERMIVQDACSNILNLTISTNDFVRLDDDGFSRTYRIDDLGNSTYDLLRNISDIYKPCSSPNACGAYGVCSLSNTFGTAVSSSCRCLSGSDNLNLSNVFRPVNVNNPTEGCRRNIALNCGDPSLQSLEEITEVTYMPILSLFEHTWEDHTMPLETCKIACSLNCSCSGFFYYTNSSYCLPFGDDTPLSNVTFFSLPSNEHIAFVKVQRPHAEEHGSVTIVIFVLTAFLSIIFILVAIALFLRWKHSVDLDLKLAEEELLGVLPIVPTRYSYQELKLFTDGFSRRLGSGGFGSVYEGMLPDGRRIAVKNLEVVSRGHREFLAEIATIGGIRHTNVVLLYGFCLEKQHRLLVFEYMQNRSLDRWLFCEGDGQDHHMLSWKTRFNIAVGTARGLAYLHEGCPKPILHFDVKPQNILLDENFDAKLADFGLAKLVARGQLSVETLVRGTPGYIAPEWILDSRVTNKCDVYSFGMVLFELVSGRKNSKMDITKSEEHYFPAWASRKAREGKFVDLTDKRLVQSMMLNENCTDEVQKLIMIALLCVQQKPEMRPNMMTVCGMLDGSISLPREIPAIHTSQFLPFKITSFGSIGSASHLSNRSSLTTDESVNG
ncbi:hypothetical protein KP509_34G054900 [Ceratopteris richardii]|uniref:Receptor-like serine/threonine-protein kinase n=1 Tax=Ceratopteris richardii TaxID=49495 RepID=A0A8T2QLS4_CERRI|nr:hypothetical protein KP509_34G054900 [Ceratopteris richardii]